MINTEKKNSSDDINNINMSKAYIASTPKSPSVGKRQCIAFKMCLPPRQMIELTQVSLTPISSASNHSNSHLLSIESVKAPSSFVTPIALVPSNLPPNPDYFEQDVLQESQNSLQSQQSQNFFLNETTKSYSSSGSFEIKFGANQVIKNVFVGGVIDTNIYDLSVLKHYNISRVLTVAYECDEVQDDTIDHKKIPFRDCIDGSAFIKEKLMECLEFIDEGVNQGQKVLVHCFAGLSRSVTIVMAYIMKNKAEKLKKKKENNETIDKNEFELYHYALELVQQKRCENAMPGNLGFIEILYDYEEKLLAEIDKVKSVVNKEN